MLSELPKLLGRSFAVGFLLPATVLTACNVYLAVVFGYLSEEAFEVLTSENPWLGATALAVATWVVALLLLGANRTLFRLKEGYGLLNVSWNPFKILERALFRRLEQRIAALKKARDSQDERAAPSGSVRAKLIRQGQHRALRFPDEERFLLPTAFGNTIRAFEVYPRVMYGVESTEMWTRLLAVVPKDYREFVDLAKAQVDFWLNLWAAFLLVIIECIALRLLAGYWEALWPLLLSAAIAVPFCSYWSRKLAIQWGRAVKACFDLFLPDLRRKMELPAAKERSAERELWQKVSQAVLFHLPDVLPERQQGIAGSGSKESGQ